MLAALLYCVRDAAERRACLRAHPTPVPFPPLGILEPDGLARHAFHGLMVVRTRLDVIAPADPTIHRCLGSHIFPFRAASRREANNRPLATYAATPIIGPMRETLNGQRLGDRITMTAALERQCAACFAWFTVAQHRPDADYCPTKRCKSARARARDKRATTAQ